MKNLVIKELKLATPLLTYLFLGFSLMTFIPGYPILCGAFFVCLGIFQGYQMTKDDHDILYSVLLPISKKDIVKGKYITVILLEMIAFIICFLCTMIRMYFLSDAIVYTTNPLMGANFTFLSFVLLLFMMFNIIFIGGYFKTANYIGKPFLVFIIINFIIITIAEILHYIPFLKDLYILDFHNIGSQLILFMISICFYIIGTIYSCKKSQIRFEKIDL